MIFLKDWHSLTYNESKIYIPAKVNKEVFIKIAKQSLEEKNIWYVLRRFYLRAILIETKNKIFASADHCKSVSLFYCEKNFKISNNVERIQNSKKNLEIEKNFSYELLKSGYMSSNRTIFSNVKQLRAGEALIYDKKSNRLTTKKYFNYLPDSKNTKQEIDLLKIHEKILNEEFLRIIKKNKDKLILVPLSGGLDSRLIISKLVELGHKRIIAFSYGPKDSFEVRIAKKVCKILSVKWIYINQSSKDYKNYFDSKKIKKFWKFCDFYSTLPNNQDLLAIDYLKSKKIIDRNSIIINGQTGDFITGGHIPKSLIGNKIKKDILFKEIIKKHYSLLKFESKNKINLKNIINKIFNNIDKKIKTLVTLYEYWEYEERQSKFIIGGQRVYDFYDLQWELPFWSYSYVNFWKNVPYNFKINQYLYKTYLKKYDYKGLFTSIKIKNQGWGLFHRYWVKPISIFCKYILGRKIQNDFLSFAKYFDRFSYYYSAYGIREFLKYYKKLRNPNSLFVIKWVKLINEEFE